jgi:hypothetical protein
MFPGNMKNRYHLGDLGAEGEIYWNGSQKKWDENDHWINLAQDIVKWLALVNTVMNHGAPQKARNFLAS